MLNQNILRRLSTFENVSNKVQISTLQFDPVPEFQEHIYRDKLLDNQNYRLGSDIATAQDITLTGTNEAGESTVTPQITLSAAWDGAWSHTDSGAVGLTLQMLMAEAILKYNQ